MDIVVVAGLLVKRDFLRDVLLRFLLIPVRIVCHELQLESLCLQRLRFSNCFTLASSCSLFFCSLCFSLYLCSALGAAAAAASTLALDCCWTLAFWRAASAELSLGASTFPGFGGPACLARTSLGGGALLVA